jgi:hypothetical protein
LDGFWCFVWHSYPINMPDWLNHLWAIVWKDRFDLFPSSGATTQDAKGSRGGPKPPLASTFGIFSHQIFTPAMNWKSNIGKIVTHWWQLLTLACSLLKLGHSTIILCRKM